MARFVLRVSWIQKQAHAEEVMGHAQREVGGTLRASSQFWLMRDVRCSPGQP